MRILAAAVIFTGITALVVWLSLRRINFKRRALSLNWPTNVGSDEIARYAAYYLRQAGWSISVPWRWIGLRLRASKNGQWLLMVIPDPRVGFLKTLIDDTANQSARLGAPVTILAHGLRASELEHTDCPANVLVMRPSDLPHAVDRLREYKNSCDKNEVAPAETPNSMMEDTAEIPEQLAPNSTSHTAAAPAQPIQGCVDQIASNFVGGWAFSSATPDDHLLVEISLQGTVIGTGQAARYRRDLEKAGFGRGDHGFLVEVAGSISAADSGSISVDAIRPNGQRRSLLVLPRALAQFTPSVAADKITVTAEPEVAPATAPAPQQKTITGAVFDKSNEPVRLVVWDLDDTFWTGTVTEGGIRDYVQEHHDLVVTLARRGIMSSICSKNDFETISNILREKGIFDYFIFPSISWEPKGSRIASLIETVQLRPSSVMFLDDNPNNRAEAAAAVPGIQVQDETFICRILDDPRFKGKDDSALTRLAQYKLLEQRKGNEAKSSGNNEEFLRSCDIKVYIEYDVGAHLDRAIELINRTNQLNFTKRRLPENAEDAKRMLLDEISFFARQAGLIRVSDNYGDYGFVGFFVMETLRTEHVAESVNSTLRHFCFSCRTLGMYVEQWLYEYLGRPQIHVSGDVLTDLSVSRNIDWIHLAASATSAIASHETLSDEIRIYGGCEANAVGVYLGPYASRVEVLGNFRVGGLFVRVNGAALALSLFDRGGADFASEAAALGLPIDLASRDYFASSPYGTVFVFSCARDARTGFYYQHRVHGWKLALDVLSYPGVDFNSVSDDEIQDRIRSIGQAASVYLEQILHVARHVRANYDSVWEMTDDQKVTNVISLIERVPIGSKLVLVLDHDKVRGIDGILHPAPSITKYNELMMRTGGRYSYVDVVSFSDVISDEVQIQAGGNHYERMVYLRMAGRLVDIVKALPGKETIAPGDSVEGYCDTANPVRQSVFEPN